ncbi:LysR family transcriptional regulator [Roseomonas sp. M0104]|uniref:LysR family transcriptional regulator n=1 Tax=Teichococcus coralli TaxID=2545983 RepID=A0A845BBS0_9PROT|nr:LysR family transcriptional regulator [Pseudoroseomonas coralli]MXP64285.1 LysR family transcriptional regulator [Pseudoroseomonas coralli]
MRDLRSLETFVWVAHLGGFRAAAARLHTTQPAVSARIQQLEQDLGVTLFQPRQRRATLTPEGATLLRYAEQMLELRGEMLRSVAHPAVVQGALRLGLSETLVHILLPRLVERIAATYPSLVLDMVVDITPALREQLLSGAIDIAMLVDAVDDPRAVNQPLCGFPLGWIARPDLGLPDRPLRLSELTRWPLLSFPHHTSVSAELRQAFARTDASGLRLWGSASVTTMVRLALDGVGISVMQPVMVRRELAEGRLRLLEVEDVVLPPVNFQVSYLRKPDSYLAGLVAGLACEIAAQIEGAENAAAVADKENLSRDPK